MVIESTKSASGVKENVKLILFSLPNKKMFISCDFWLAFCQSNCHVRRLMDFTCSEADGRPTQKNTYKDCKTTRCIWQFLQGFCTIP